MTFVIDSSALLAALLGEKGSEIVEPLLDQALISTVNIAEVAAALVRGGNPVEDVRRILAGLGLAAIAPDEAMAINAGLLRVVTDEAGL